VSGGYWVHGVALVNCGEDRCAACDRPAVGYSIAGHLLCATHAGVAAEAADELAREKAASQARRTARGQVDLVRVRSVRLDPDAIPGDAKRRRKGQQSANATPVHFKCGHSTEPANVYTDTTGYHVCRTCKRQRRAKNDAAHRLARERMEGFEVVQLHEAGYIAPPEHRGRRA
jgi:hypothetical protein